jgi:hypothetical protein
VDKDKFVLPTSPKIEGTLDSCFNMFLYILKQVEKITKELEKKDKND